MLGGRKLELARQGPHCLHRYWLHLLLLFLLSLNEFYTQEAGEIGEPQRSYSRNREGASAFSHLCEFAQVVKNPLSPSFLIR